jgi:hypothetical protein
VARPVLPLLEGENWEVEGRPPRLMFRSGPNPNREVAIAALEPLRDPISDREHVLTYELEKDLSGGGSVAVVVQLREGVSVDEPGTLIHEWRHRNMSAKPKKFTRQLPIDSAARIRNYEDLYVVLIADQGL